MIKNLFSRASRRRLSATLIILCCGLMAQAYGQTKSPASVTASSLTSPGRMIEIDKARALIPDAQVFDHQGKKVRLYTNLIKGKVVLLNFFYSTCTYICPVQGDALARLQYRLGKSLGKDVFLISISMNPEEDGAENLKQWAKAFGVKPGWTIVGGSSPEMKKMIKDFTGNDAGPRESHFTVVFIGNDKTGAWVAANGLDGTKNLIELIESVKFKAPVKDLK